MSDLDKALAFFSSHVSKTPTCWIWTGSSRKGYGILKLGRTKTIKAHRLSYEISRGIIPDRLEVLHECDTPLCVNPSHLFLGTQADNMKDMVAKGRQSKGSHRPASKLDEKTVKWIRSNYVKGHKEFGAVPIAKRLGVNYYTVMNIITGKTWKHVL